MFKFVMFVKSSREVGDGDENKLCITQFKIDIKIGSCKESDQFFIVIKSMHSVEPFYCNQIHIL